MGGLVKNGEVISGKDLEGAQAVRPPLFLCRDKTSNFVSVPKTKIMHQILRIDFDNYIFSTSEGAQLSQTPCPHRG